MTVEQEIDEPVEDDFMDGCECGDCEKTRRVLYARADQVEYTLRLCTCCTKELLETIQSDGLYYRFVVTPVKESDSSTFVL